VTGSLVTRTPFGRLHRRAVDHTAATAVLGRSTVVGNMTAPERASGEYPGTVVAMWPVAR
jgi:hypothetical protein